MTLVAFALALALDKEPFGVTRPELEEVVRHLASPALEGRLTLAPGEHKAAEWLVAEFRRIGLEEGPNPGYVHEFDVTVNARPVGPQEVELRHDDGRVWTLRVGRDFVPLNGTAPATDRAARVVFVGYGIQSETWDDYAGVDVTGDYVVLLRGTPNGHAPVRMRDRAALAKEKGAIGVVTLGPQSGTGTALPRPTRGAGFATDLELIGIGLHADLTDEIKGQDWADVRSLTRPASRELPMTLEVTTAMEPNKGRGRNVIGYLPGNDPAVRDEIVVIGAHYDHLGFGEVGSRTGAEILHPGADDNASGVAAVIELAEHFAETRSNRRTLVFQLYSGEEVGLIGAAAWVRDNPEKIARTSAMVNMDMIGRLRNGTVTVFGTSSSNDWPSVIEGVEEPGLKLNPVATISASSDHAPFARAKVPVVFFHTGLTDEYHTERDTFETLNFDGMVAVTRAVGRTIERLDQRPSRLVWNPTAQIAQRGAGRSVRLGLVPDMGDSTGPGVRLQGVQPDSPASRAGLRAGDRIVQIGDRTIDGPEALQAAFGQMRAGQATPVTVIRDGERVTVSVTPVAST